MSTAVPAAGQPMPVSELIKGVGDIAAKSAAAAVAEAMKDLKSGQDKQHGELLEKLARPDKDEAPAGFDDSVLGKYPIGRKVRALALLTLEGKQSGSPVTADDIPWAEKVISKHWTLHAAESTKKWFAHVKTTMAAGVANAAGDMVMPEMDTEWIALLRNSTVVRGIARTLPMPRGAATRRKQTGPGTATYQGELGPIVASNQTVGRANLSYKKLTALTVVSNDLIRFTAGDADRFVQEDLLAVCGLREDRAFLVGNPPTDVGSPQGIRYQTRAANVYATTGTTLAQFQADLTKAIRLVQASNVRATPDNSYFVISPSTFWTMYALATTTGDMIFAQMLSGSPPRIFGFPVLLTTQLEVSNSFIGASAGMIFFIHAPSMEIHDSMQRTVATYIGGAYYDGSVVQSGISNDETVITCIAEHDFLQVYDTAASIITGYAT